MAVTSHNLTGRPRPGRRGGFTLIEMLVVLGIMLLLAGILFPAINKAYQQGVRTRMAADLQAIAVGLEEYKREHGDYPRVNAAGAANSGDAVLCRALVAPQDAAQDGEAGFGFRTRPAVGGVPQGKKCGPYINMDKFKIDPVNLWILDRSGRRILYLPANKGATINIAGGYIADFPYTGSTTAARPMFNSLDIKVALFDHIDPPDNGNAANGRAKFLALMGADTTGKAINPVFTGEYLLWAAGPDQLYGCDEMPTDPKFNPYKSDDVANFTR
jgi:prepilin-type N-terminal cleavage/methylation domain-containing protein